MSLHYLDQFSLVTLFIATFLLLGAAIEGGFRIGRREKRYAAKAQTSQVRAIMGASLGLLAFMMAFTFATAQRHYENRVQLLVEEVRLANNAFLQADLVNEPYRAELRALLREYIGDRNSMDQLVEEDRVPEIFELIEKAERMHLDLWRVTLASQGGTGDEGASRSPLMTSIIGLIDVHAQRVQAALMNRIPNVIWLSLYFTAMLAMLVMGYQAGLVTKRSPVATYTLAMAFSAVLMLITDLDRPIMSMFQISNQPMLNLADRMDLILESPQPAQRP